MSQHRVEGGVGKRQGALRRPSDPAARTVIEEGLSGLERKYSALQRTIEALAELGFIQARRLYEVGNSCLQRARDKYVEDDYAIIVAYMESSLTMLHDIVEVTMPQTVGPGEQRA